MRHLFRALTFLFLMPWCAAASAQDARPLESEASARPANPIWPGDWADPTVWLGEDGRYHSLSTHIVRSIVSDDLFHWKPTGTAPVDDTTRDSLHALGEHLWAPDVQVVGGKRNLYLTLHNTAEDSRIAVLTETLPGEFRLVRVLTDSKATGIHDTIDPEVVTDPKTGKVWLFFGSVGGIHRIELAKDGLSLKDGARYEHVAGLRIEQNADRSKVFEGSYLHRHKGYWYLFVSSGHYFDGSYELKVGRARKLTGTFLDREGRRMDEGFATTILRSEEGDRFYGPGHCGEIFQGKDGREYIFYHCHDRENRRPASRPLFVSRIQWDRKGWPYVEGGKPQQAVIEQ